MKKLFTFLSIATLFATVVQTANAAGGTSNCQIVYGGGEVCQQNVQFTVNKLVQAPNGTFVENLTLNDPRFSPGQNINFKIVVENTGSADITNLNVVDNFPQFLTFAGGVANATPGAQQINFVVPSLAHGQKQEFIITSKVADAAALPNDRTITCVTNNVTATSPDGSVAQDNAQACIEKTIFTATPTPMIFQKPTVNQIPSTGPELGYLVGLIPTGLAGFWIKRKSN